MEESNLGPIAVRQSSDFMGGELAEWFCNIVFPICEIHRVWETIFGHRGRHPILGWEFYNWGFTFARSPCLAFCLRLLPHVAQPLIFICE
jgi:hypothetical protein